MSNRSIFVWIGVLLALFVALEAATRAGFDRLSKLQYRMLYERALLKDELTGSVKRPTILMVGNSLLLEGVDFSRLREALKPHALAYRFIVTQTVYFDWYYGLRRLFAEGVRPSYLLLGMSASHLVRSSIRGDYSAYYLFDLPGLMEYSYREHLDPTTASSLVFAHFSKLYGVRSEVRATLLEKALPGYADALHQITGGAMQGAALDSSVETAAERLHALDQLCRENRTQLLFVLPPTDSSSEPIMLAAGKKAGVPVLLPVKREALRDDQFSDGFHLNSEGRGIFTSALIGDLETVLPSRSTNANMRRGDTRPVETAARRSGD